MEDYEGMFIVRPDLDQVQSENAAKNIEEAITSNKGTIKENLAWGKRQLSYKISKYREGLYRLVHFQIDPSNVKKIRRVYGLNENILKMLIIRRS
ncbi:MAG: 30S ribosomal protein S6 [Candidatus Omnitrophota bacterium]|nr:30S ribosomal protein S6 [Candidatus Omnitrophota bacterium]